MPADYRTRPERKRWFLKKESGIISFKEISGGEMQEYLPGERYAVSMAIQFSEEAGGTGRIDWQDAGTQQVLSKMRKIHSALAVLFVAELAAAIKAGFPKAGSVGYDLLVENARTACLDDQMKKGKIHTAAIKAGQNQLEGGFLQR
jgi:hypothetical protein